MGSSVVFAVSSLLRSFELNLKVGLYLESTSPAQAG